MLKRSIFKLREFIYPGPYKGWDPSQFDSMGKAMQIARTNKGIEFKKLAQATGISEERLRLIEGDELVPIEQERRIIEKYIGVHLVNRNESRVDRCI